MLVTDPEPKIAEILQQILVSLCWLDYDEVKQDCERTIGIQQSASGTLARTLDLP